MFCFLSAISLQWVWKRGLFSSAWSWHTQECFRQSLLRQLYLFLLVSLMYQSFRWCFLSSGPALKVKVGLKHLWQKPAFCAILCLSVWSISAHLGQLVG